MLGLMYLAEKTNEIEEMRSYLEMMKGRVHTLDGFIQEITDHSRNARLQVTAEPVLIHGLVTTIIDNLRYLKGAEQIRFENAIDPGCEVITDLTRVKMVLNNLIGNAIKHHNLNRTNPFVRITCSRHNGNLNITVEDNGKGIKPEHQNRVFDMFYRASEDSGGSGLGLYIVKETLEKLRGTVRLQSTYGSGSAFTVSLPVAAR
jgi:signal transduction histidine kinase